MQRLRGAARVVDGALRVAQCVRHSRGHYCLRHTGRDAWRGRRCSDRQETGAAGDKDAGCDRCLLQCEQRGEKYVVEGGDELLRVPGEVDEIACCGAMVRGESGPDGRAGGQCAGGDEARRIPRPECLPGLPLPAWPLEADDDSPSCRPVANCGGARPPHRLLQRHHINASAFSRPPGGIVWMLLNCVRRWLLRRPAPAPAASAKQGLTKQAQLLGRWGLGIMLGAANFAC